MGRLIKTRLKSYSIDLTPEEYESVMTFLSSVRGNTKKQTKKKNRQQSLSADQEAALEVMESGENVFLTGGAGTGKTFLLDRFLSNKRQAVRVAPTGKAAIKVGGMTLHRFFHAPIGIIQPSSLPEIGTDRKDAETALTKILRKRGAKLMKTVEIIATIIIKVVPDGVARNSTIKNSLTSCLSIINLLLILPDAAIRHTIEVTNCMTLLNARYV